MRLYSPQVEVTAVFSEAHEKFQKIWFLKEPKAANSNQYKLWQKKKRYTVSETHGAIDFFRLAINGEEKFPLYISLLCNFPLQVHCHTHTRFITFLLKTKKPQAERQTPPTPRNALPSHGLGAADYQQFPGGALMGVCWDWCCICSTYPFVENPYIIRPAGTSESQKHHAASP